MRSRPPHHRAWALVLALGAIGCGGSTVGPTQASTKRATVKAPAYAKPARLFAIPDARAAGVASEPSGARHHITHGMRLTVGPEGTLRRSSELFPTAQPIQHALIPDRLGGGYLFYASGGGRTWLWRAKTWTSKLEPLTNISFESAAVVAGFDRFYLRLKNTHETIALDPKTGKAIGLGPLPASPAYGNMAFADEWLGAVHTEYRGLLVTFDAGATWRSLPIATFDPHVQLAAGRVIAHTPRGTLELDPTGTLREPSTPVPPPSGGRFAQPPPSPTEDDAGPRVGPLGPLPLRTAVHRGWPDSPNSALVAHGGALARVSLEDGEVLDVDEGALPGGGECRALRVASTIGFVCGHERGRTVVYELSGRFDLRPVLEFDAPRFVASSGNGAIVVRGPCRADADVRGDSAGSAYCIRSRDRQTREIRVRGDLGVERVVALRDGRAAVIIPPRHGAKGLLTLVDENGAAKTVKMKLPKKDADESVLALLRKGLWLEGFVEYKKGELRGWVAAAGPFIGVRIRLDGRVEVGEMQSGLEHTLLSGPFALILGRSGRASESTDGGFAWREVDVPAELANRGSGMPKRGRTDERGCGPAGCAFGTWLRVGWKSKSDDDRSLPVVDPPSATSIPRPRGGRWRYQCAPSGRLATVGTAPPPPTPPPRPMFRHHWRHRGRMVLPSIDSLESTAFPPFFGLPPPRRGPGDLGLDQTAQGGDGLHIRGYTWGPKAAWGSRASWQIRGVDPFVIDGAVWSTAATRVPWADLMTTAQKFGRDPTHVTDASWFSALEPSGTAGVLSISGRTGSDLFVFEQGRTISQVAKSPSPLAFLGAVRARGAWFVGHRRGGDFVVSRIGGDSMTDVGTYPARMSGNRGVPKLVRSARADAIGIWVRDRKTRSTASSWYVFPIDLETGRAEAPIRLDAKALSRTPQPCSSDDDGWVLSGEAHIDPIIEMVRGAESVGADDVNVRLLATSAGLCVDSLAARYSSDIPRLAAAAGWPASGKSTAPLVLVGSQQRVGFRCVH